MINETIQTGKVIKENEDSHTWLILEAPTYIYERNRHVTGCLNINRLLKIGTH